MLARPQDRGWLRLGDTTQRVFTGAPWEKKVGYCRAIRRADWVLVSGTVAVAPDGSVLAPESAHQQAVTCFETIKKALAELGADLSDVMRTRMYVADIGDWSEIGRAHVEYFGAHPPVTTLVEVARLIDPALKVEVEAEALLLRRAR